MEFTSSPNGCVALLWAFQLPPECSKTCTVAWFHTLNRDVSAWVTGVDTGPSQDTLLSSLYSCLWPSDCRDTHRYSFIHTENRLKYWNGTIIPVKHLIIILPCDYLWEQTPGPSADPDRFSPFVHVTLPGPVLRPGTWNPSALMSSCSIRYICAKLFIVGCWAAIVLFCSLHGAKSQFTGEPWTVCIDEWDLLLNRIASN